MSAAIVIGVVAVLVLLGIGMVVNQLLRLRRYLNDSSPDRPPTVEPHDPPGPIAP